jgi:dipeptidyl aminopeptidase/acylaminoacyl peptidase
MTQAGVGVASVEYRLYPQAVYPDFLEDCAQAVAYIVSHKQEMGNPERLYVSGQSAGAWLTLMLAMDSRWLDRAGADRRDITGYISDSAQVTTHFNVLRERGLDTRLERIDEAAPLFWLSDECPADNLLLLWYTEDMPCRPEQNRLLLRGLQRFFPDRNIRGVELPGGHCSGSANRNEKGTFDYADLALDFMG